MARYRKYRHGGRTVPGMFKAGGEGNGDGTLESKNTEGYMGNTNIQYDKEGNPIIESKQNDVNVANNLGLQQQKMQQAYALQMQKLKMQQHQKMQEMLMQMKLQNEQLNAQNNLLETKINKMDLINSVRTTKTPPGPKNTPKKFGGSNRKRPIIGNNIMRKGGSCLPGGRFSKRKKY